MKYTLAQKMNHSLRWLLAIGAASAVGVQGMYLYKFGSWPITLSNDPAAWGQYGDYIGGLLNPIFSSLAFSGLVVTIVLQARQIDEGKHHAELEEMQRVQSTVAARIDQLLTSSVIVDPGKNQELARLAGNPQTVFQLISSLGTMVLSEPDKDQTDWGKWLWTDKSLEGLRAVLDAQTAPLRLEFEALSFMLLRYEASSGSNDVMAFYRYRYAAVLIWLDALELLTAHKQVQEFFQPHRLHETMNPEGR
jgi:uncharacterized membrane protein